jgi:hypothetical protein
MAESLDARTEGQRAGAPLRPCSGVVAREMDGLAVLIHLETNRIYELNPTGARIWHLLQQGLDRPAICGRLRDEFQVSEDEIGQAVDALLTDLAREGLVGA